MTTETDHPSLNDWQSLLEQIAHTDWQIALVVSGGGTMAIQRCFARTGASKNFVEAVVPYSRLAMSQYLGAKLQTPATSAATATKLATIANAKSMQLSDRQSMRHAGISLTASLPTQPPRDQQHQIHVALMLTDQQTIDQTTSTLTRAWSRNLEPELASRGETESIAEAMFFAALQTLLQ